MISLPPLKLTDLGKIFPGGTSHHEVPPSKISSKSEHVRYQKLCSKIKNLKKLPQTLSFYWGQCHNLAGMYEPWAKIP